MMRDRLWHFIACAFGRHSESALLRVDGAPEGYLTWHTGAPTQVGWYACLWCGRPINGTMRYRALAKSRDAWWS